METLWATGQRRNVTKLFVRKAHIKKTWAQQHWDAERVRVEATKIAAFASTQVNDEFRTWKNVMSKNDEFYHNSMQEFAAQAEETLALMNAVPCEKATQELSQHELCTLFSW